MRTPVFIAVVVFLFSSSHSQQKPNSRDMNSESFKFLALGDSYTIGESVEDDERWPSQLVTALRNRHVPIADPIIIARTGWTTDELNKAIDERRPIGPFDLVSLLIGVNNQYRGRSAEEYRTEFKALLQRAIGFAGNKASRVLVVSIPDWGVMPFADGRDRTQITKEIDSFNAINWEESVRAGVRYVDITPISREVERYPELIASDGLHPSFMQYKYWVELIEPKALTAFGVATEKEKK